MIPASLARKLKKQIQLYEGNIPHMYLDSKGYVTVGIGSLISSATVAQKLPFEHDKTHKKATASEIKIDFNKVLKANPLQIKYKSSFYKKYTRLILSQNMINKLFMSQITLFYKELRWLYAQFDTYPVEVKLALFDMIFNLGVKKLKRKFPKFNKAIDNRDWFKAAQESHRQVPVSPKRNAYVKKLLTTAAKNKFIQLKTRQTNPLQNTP